MPYDDDFWTSMGATPPPPPEITAPVPVAPAAPAPEPSYQSRSPYEGLPAEDWPMPTPSRGIIGGHYHGTALVFAAMGLIVVCLAAWYFSSMGRTISSSKSTMMDEMTRLQTEHVGTVLAPFRVQYGRYGTLDEVRRYAGIDYPPSITITILRADETGICVSGTYKRSKVTYYYDSTAAGLLPPGRTCR